MPKKYETKQELLKSRTISARLDPQIFYRLVLLSRAQRRNLSEVVEWCIQSVIQGHAVPGGTEKAAKPTRDLEWIAIETWSTNYIERIVKLAILCPDLLDFTEANMWRVIEGTPELWAESSTRHARKRTEFLWDQVENLQADVEAYIKEAAERYPVTGLTEKQISQLGWVLSPKRSQN